MLSKLRDAFDRTLAEEQARHKAAAEQRSGTSAPTTPQPTQGTESPGHGDSVHPDPAVFEAAFKLAGESSAPGRSVTPKPTGSEEQNPPQPQNDSIDDSTSARAPEKSDDAAVAPELPPDIAKKLLRLQKLENNFPTLLKSYRTAHSRIEPFEKVLREHTPLSSIKDPDALVEYLNQLNMKTEMTARELTRVSAEKELLQTKQGAFETQLATLKDEVAASKSALSGGGGGKDADEGATSDDKISDLQAELALRAENISRLDAEITTLKEQLAAAKVTDTMVVEDSDTTITLPEGSNDASTPPTEVEGEPNVKVAEIESLKTALEKALTDHKDLENKISEERKVTAVTIDNHVADKSQISEKITSLQSEIETYKKIHAEQSEKVQELTDALARQSAPSPEPTVASTNGLSKAQKRKNKNAKNNKNNKNGDMPRVAAGTPTTKQPGPSDHIEDADLQALNAQISKLLEEATEKDLKIEKLSKQKKTVDELQEEIGDLQENILLVGQELVEAQKKIKKLDAEKPELKTENSELNLRISKLQKELDSVMDRAAKLVPEHESAKKEIHELKLENQRLQKSLESTTTELGAQINLSQNRFKELATCRERIEKLQTDINSLRQASNDLTSARKDLAVKQDELLALRKQEKELKNDLTRVQRGSSDDKATIKLLNEQLSAEKALVAKAENEKRTLGRDYRRAEAEKTAISDKIQKADADLTAAHNELTTLRPKIKDLEEVISKTQRERDLAKEEAGLKTQQYINAQNLLASMRNQSNEMSMQLKEAKAHSESIDEELVEAEKHLAERTREGETMRRMLTEANQQADAKIHEMRMQMEAAVEERDRVEEEATTTARRRAREIEELKNKVRELERDAKLFNKVKDEFEAREKEWRDYREEMTRLDKLERAELDDLRRNMESLRRGIDAYEQQVADAEKQKADLKKLLDETRNRYEKENKELKRVIQSRNVPSSNGRSSIDSVRSAGQGSGSPAMGSSQGGDTTYIKTVFLQFLEQKDDKVRTQLIPVLGRLLGFDKSEEQRGMKALQAMTKPK